MTNRGGIKSRLISFFVSLIVMVIFGELFLSIFYGKKIRPYRLRLYDENIMLEPYLREGDYISYELKRNYSGSWQNCDLRITTDRRGFRTFPGEMPRPCDRIDILCMGDSFTFGYLVGDEQTYPYYLQKIMDEKVPGVAVANGGYAGGFSFDTAYLRFKNELCKYRPKLVLYGLYPNNDYEDIGVWADVDDSGLPRKIRTLPQFKNGFYKIPILRESCLFVATARPIYGFFLKEEAILKRQKWRKIEKVVEAFNNEAIDNGAHLVFIFLNSPIRRERAACATENGCFKRLLKRHGIDYWDNQALLDFLEGAIKSKELLLPPYLPREELRAEIGDLLMLSKDPIKILTSSDGLHYSAVMNVYLASWIYERLCDSQLMRALHTYRISFSAYSG